MSEHRGQTEATGEAMRVLGEVRGLIRSAEARAEELVTMTHDLRDFTVDAIRLHAALQAARAQLESLDGRLRQAPDTPQRK